MGDEPEITQAEKVTSDTLSLDKTLNSKCHSNVEPKIKDGQKNKRLDTPKKKNKESRKRRHSSSSDDSEAKSDTESSDESDSDEDLSHPSDGETSQDEDQVSRFSTKQSKKNKWKFNKEMRKYAKNKFLKHISDIDLKESILDKNPVPTNFVSRQKLDDYLQEILSETGKKDEIFSDRSLMKAQGNLTNVMGPLSRLWAYFDNLKKYDKGVTDLDFSNKFGGTNHYFSGAMP